MAFDFPPDAAPIIAILRGVRPNEILAMAAALEAAGIRAIEVPLNSPDPFDSIAKLCAQFGKRCLCGAGTVLDPDAVDAVQRAGARLVVTPNTEPAVIERAARHGLTVIPGFATATARSASRSAASCTNPAIPQASWASAHAR